MSVKAEICIFCKLVVMDGNSEEFWLLAKQEEEVLVPGVLVISDVYCCCLFLPFIFVRPGPFPEQHKANTYMCQFTSIPIQCISFLLLSF